MFLIQEGLFLEVLVFARLFTKLLLPAFDVISSSEASNLAPLASRVVNPILTGTESLLQCCVQ